MHSEDQRPNDLIYGLDDRPRPLPAFLAALQHVLASFVGIVTPPLVIGSLLGLGEHLPYLISMALMVSGAGTLIQARRPFGIGAGMICLQGTSFAFLGAVLAAGMLVKQRGGGPEEILAMIFGVCFFGAFVQIVLSRFLGHLRRVITPLVTGIVITLIGVSLIKVGITDLGGGAGTSDFGAPANLALGALVLLSIVLLNRSRLPWLRLAAIVIGLALGTLAAWATGLFVPRALPELPLVSLPQPFRFGFAFDWMAFLPVALIYLISSIETVGDLTANCMLSRQPLEGPAYLQRLRGGVLGARRQLPAGSHLQRLPEHHLRAEQRGDPAHRGGQPARRDLYRRRVAGARPVPLGRRDPPADPQAGARWRHPGDVRQRRRRRHPHSRPDRDGPPQRADHRRLVRRRPRRGRAADPARPDAGGGEDPVRLGDHQRRHHRHPAQPAAARGARCRSGAGQREGRRPGALAQAAGLIRAFANFSAPGLCPAAGLGYQRGDHADGNLRMTLTVPAHDPAARDKPAGRIRQKNEEAILAAAEEEFARHGFKGTSMNTIAQNVGLPKANLHYYFGNKLGLYTAVLSNILELWDSTFNTLGVDDDPAEALARYIRAKMEFSRRYPLASRIFAMEIISGGECLTAHFNQDYRSWFRGRAAVFEAWIAAGRMDPVDPVHLIFLLWAAPSTTPTSPARSAWSPAASACPGRTSPPPPTTWCGSSSRAAD